MRCVIDGRSNHSWPRRLLCAGAIGWAVLIPSAAVAAGRASGAPVVGLLAALPYVGRGRDLPSAGRPILRDLVAAVAGLRAMYGDLRGRRGDCGCGHVPQGSPPSPRLRRSRSLRHNPRKVAQRFSAARTLVFAALPTAATLAYEWSTSTAPSNVVRAIAGFPLGAAVAWAILSAVDDQVN